MKSTLPITSCYPPLQLRESSKYLAGWDWKLPGDGQESTEKETSGLVKPRSAEENHVLKLQNCSCMQTKIPNIFSSTFHSYVLLGKMTTVSIFAITKIPPHPSFNSNYIFQIYLRNIFPSFRFSVMKTNLIWWETVLNTSTPMQGNNNYRSFFLMLDYTYICRRT